ALAAAQKIDVSKPFSGLPGKPQPILLEGATANPGGLGLLSRLYKDVPADHSNDSFMRNLPPPPCPACHGARLKPASLAVRVHGVSIGEIVDLSVSAALEAVKNWKLTEREHQIAGRAVEEIRNRLEFLVAVGLEYLSLERSAATLSGGEA